MNDGESLTEVVKLKCMRDIPWFSGWLVCFSLEKKGITLDIEVFCATPCRGGIPLRLFCCWPADYFCVRVSIVGIVRCKGVKPVAYVELLHHDSETCARSPASGAGQDLMSWPLQTSDASIGQ